MTGKYVRRFPRQESFVVCLGASGQKSLALVAVCNDSLVISLPR
jgi:hypothetical protein